MEQNMDIFRCAAEFMTQEDFRNAQFEFMQKNVDQFEDSEENKLIYTEIHQSYMYILEELIESKLK